MIFDCGKEFPNWRSISNSNDIAVFFADSGTPSQSGINKHSNGLLRKDDLSKTMDFRDTDEIFIQSVASKRKPYSKIITNYRTPLEVILSYIDKEILSNLTNQINKNIEKRC